MKRYLFNTVSDPRQATNWKDAIRLDRLEHNPGDMVYTHGVMNLLSTDSKMDWIPTGYYYDRIFGDEEIDRINATCSAFILPMADIFSKSWARLLPRKKK